MVDGFHEFSAWIPWICNMESGLARWIPYVEFLVIQYRKY